MPLLHLARRFGVAGALARRSVGRLLPWLPFAFAVAAVGFVLLNIASFRAEIEVPPAGTTGEAVPPAGWTSSGDCRASPRLFGCVEPASLEEEITSFNAAKRTISARVSLAFTKDMVRQLAWFDRQRRKVVPLRTVPHNMWANLPVSIQLCVRRTSVESNCFVPIATIPLGQLVAQHGSFVADHTPVTVPVRGWPVRFPSDSYAFGIISWATLPDPVGLGARRKGFESDWSIAPTRVTLVASGLGDDTLTAYETQNSGRDAIYGFIGRPLAYRVTVYGVALLPLLLGVVVVHASARQATMKKTSSPVFDLGLIAALIGAMLAILPLRAVLVPADVSLTGLTAVDYILLLDLLFIAAFVFFQYARFVTKRQVPGPAEPPQSSAAAVETEPK